MRAAASQIDSGIVQNLPKSQSTGFQTPLPRLARCGTSKLIYSKNGYLCDVIAFYVVIRSNNAK